MLTRIAFITSSNPDITDDNLFGSVDLTQEINTGEDYSIGVASSACLTFETNALEDPDSIGAQFFYHNKQISEENYKRVGRFIIHDIEKVDSRYKVTAYDTIANFDIVIDEWLDSLTFPMTLKSFFSSLCTYCGTTAMPDDFVNSDVMIQDNFTSTNITGRTILSYIAEMAAGYITANFQGFVQVKYYTENSTTLGPDEYVKCTKADYEVEPIDRVWVGMEDGDVGVVSGTGDNELRITYNPLMFADSASEIQDAVDNIYNQVHSLTYTPMTITLLEDFGIKVGDIIEVDDIQTVVMSKKITSSGVELSSVGNKVRSVSSNAGDSAINALRGKYNKLKRDLEATESEVGDLAVGFTRITQTATAIESLVNGTAPYIESTETPSSPSTGTVWYNPNTGEYKQWTGSAWVEVDESVKGAAVTNKITQTLDGVVYEGLSGTTVINGSNITTGTIEADRLNLTGAISFGDCDSNLQSKINSSGEIYRQTTVPTTTTVGALWYCMQTQGSYVAGKWYSYNGTSWELVADVELPSYLKQTYIDSTSIYSPTIIGAEIYAGDASNGYLLMNDTGLELHTESSAAVPLIDIGYHQSLYQYPYIIMGQGGTGGINKGMIKKFSNGVFIGNNTDETSSTISSGTGLFVDFNEGKIYKYINGYGSELGSAVFG